MGKSESGGEEEGGKMFCKVFGVVVERARLASRRVVARAGDGVREGWLRRGESRRWGRG